jgi:hypothetical protein
MELETCLALPWDKSRRGARFFILDIFYLLWVRSRTIYGQLRYDSVPKKRNYYPSSLVMIKPKILVTGATGRTRGYGWLRSGRYPELSDQKGAPSSRKLKYNE